MGHVTVARDEPAPPEGRGVARTGVTAILPGASASFFRRPVPAGVSALNGAGELTGFLQISEWGLIETPIYLTSTMAVGRVFDGAVAAACNADAAVGVDHVVIPVVGECDDSWLNDARTVQVEATDAARAAGDAHGGVVEQGCVGAGTGMVAFDWKGGIGSSSRLVPEADATIGVLVLANYGSAQDLRIDGVPAFPTIGDGLEPRPPAGSCIAIVATDAPLQPAQLERLARRAGLGLARTGSVAHHGSGEIFLAFSTAATERDERPPLRVDRASVPDGHLDPLFAATVDATEEAVLNALWAAVDTTGREGRVVRALPHEPVLALLAKERPAVVGARRSLDRSTDRTGPPADSLLEPAGAGDPPDEPDGEDARQHEADEREQVEADDVRAVLGENPDDRRADEAAEHDQRHRDPVHRMVDVVGEVVETGVPDLDLEVSLTGLLHHVAHLVRQLARNARELPHLGLRAQATCAEVRTAPP